MDDDDLPRRRDDVLTALIRQPLDPLSVDELDDRTRTQLYNDQELINNVLTQARDDSRMICKREKKVGTHRITNICITAGERRRQRQRIEDANDVLHRGVRGGDSLFCNYAGGSCF